MTLLLALVFIGLVLASIFAAVNKKHRDAALLAGGASLLFLIKALT
jgi:cbb3-type cytochrome oxidase subunit 3